MLKLFKLIIDFFVDCFTIKKHEEKAFDYGISFDTKTHLTSLPETPTLKQHEFCQLNKDLGFFEVTFIDKKNKTITVREICTENEMVMSYTVFNYFFSSSPTPAECKF